MKILTGRQRTGRQGTDRQGTGRQGTGRGQAGDRQAGDRQGAGVTSVMIYLDFDGINFKNYDLVNGPNICLLWKDTCITH